MWSVNRPTTSSLDSFRTSISRIKGDLRSRLDSVENEIVTASADYEASAAAVSLHTVPKIDGVGGVVSTKEMVRVYESRFARSGSPGRPIYDSIRSAPAHGRCPLCGDGTVWTLDHHLPKNDFPALAVAPLNLVPACMECNKFKLAAAPATVEDETIHPYFDNIDDDPWLAAEVVEGAQTALLFFVLPPDHWTAILVERVNRQFEMLKLPYRYGVEAGRELVNLRKLITDLYTAAGAIEVQRYLFDLAATYEAARINSWQTATYKALASSDWYCNEGFRL